MGFKGSKVQILSSRPAHKRELPQGNQRKLVPFSHCIPQKRLCQRISNAALHAPSAPFPFVLLKPRIGIFQRFLHRADNVPAGIPNLFAS